jgi:AraC-like DNA-binding protein
VDTSASALTRLSMQRIGGFTHVPDLIRAMGVDPVAVLAAAGLAADALDEAEKRIPYAAFGTLLREAARWTRCPHFGLLAGRIWHLPDLGLVGELVANSPTFGSALRTMTVYQHLNSSGGLGFVLERGGNVVDVGYAIYYPDAPGADDIYDAVLAGNFTFMRDLCGATWVPTEVFLPRAKPVDVEPYRQLFHAPVHFGAEICAMRFPARWISHRIEAFDSARRRIDEARARDHVRGHVVEQVIRALRLVMLHGRHSGDEIASLLAMHRRTLTRQLSAEGTTFQALLDTVRFDVARQLLRSSELSLEDIAQSLGYADLTPFARSFRRWSGTSPGVWRRDVRRNGPETTPTA